MLLRLPLRSLTPARLAVAAWQALTVRASTAALVLGLLASATLHAASRVGEIDVRTGYGGMPCFTISQAEEQRSGEPNFQSIVVADADAVLWKMAMPKPRTFPVSPHMCIPYGGRLPVLPQTPSAPLQPGKTYEVTFHVAPSRAAGAPRLYRGRFCGDKKGGWTMARQDSHQRGACS